jgi:uncharacterized protein (DUF697 family)
MAIFNNWTWQGLGDAIFTPKAEGLESKIEDIKKQLPTPVFWLLGKTQSGKTSLIRQITGNDAAEIGNGFIPCTKTSQLYDFPSSSHPIIRFLDTRGLGEANYDPTEDLKWCANNAHLLILVLRASDMNQVEVVNTVFKIHEQHPKWPIVVIQTSLHECYPNTEFEHIQPYPYQQIPLPPEIPHDLTRVLLHQRDWFKPLGENVHFVPVDFTLPEDGYTPSSYGLEELWQTIEEVLPTGLINLLRGSKKHNELLDYHADQAHPHITGYSLLNLGLGAVPVAGIPLTIATQAKLFHSIASIYELNLTRLLYTEFIALFGTSVGIGLLGRGLVGLVPVYGWAVSGAYSGAMTYALGKAFCVYLYSVKRGALPDKKMVNETYKEAFSDARKLLKK